MSGGLKGRMAPLCSKVWHVIATLFAISVSASLVAAAESESFSNPAVEARLITAENGVGPDAASISAGLHLQLGEDWKTYWRSPGEVGLPPTIDWTGSENRNGPM